jgi:hypothetical protein
MITQHALDITDQLVPRQARGKRIFTNAINWTLAMSSNG